jgi:hypothetical protein
MTMPPHNRIEIVLMSDQGAPVHLWMQSSADAAKRSDLDKEKSVRVLAAAFLFLILMLYFLPGATVILLLIGLMIGFPLVLVRMVGCFRKS